MSTFEGDIMRKFIISDLHGDGIIYDIIMNYLENISLTDDVELFINGDLIDRGIDSYRMLIDVIERINSNGNIKITYLAGNHELMFYQACLKKYPNRPFSLWSDWIRNGGGVVAKEIQYDDELINSLMNFIKELKIYHKFEEKINNKNILLVHAKAPKDVKDVCDMKLEDYEFRVWHALWTRKEDDDFIFSMLRSTIGLNRIGLDGYITIIGHTPVSNKKGFTYNKKEEYFNIDGGCSGYVQGYYEYDHVPLVEVKKNELDFTIFNHNNEIIDGYRFNGVLIKDNEDRLNNKREYIKHNNKELIL